MTRIEEGEEVARIARKEERCISCHAVNYCVEVI